MLPIRDIFNLTINDVPFNENCRTGGDMSTRENILHALKKRMSASNDALYFRMQIEDNSPASPCLSPSPTNEHTAMQVRLSQYRCSVSFRFDGTI